jgi:nicotinamidase-related amidase
MGRFFEETGGLLEGAPGTDFVPELGPSGDEIVVTKRGVSAFAGTELAQLLHLRSIDTVLLMGLVTQFAVEGTARDACDRGYRVVTLSDCCTSGGRHRHEASLDILGRIGELTTSASLAASVV